jgi:hypothetical protein
MVGFVFFLANKQSTCLLVAPVQRTGILHLLKGNLCKITVFCPVLKTLVLACTSFRQATPKKGYT